ncbi:MAG: ABC transporter substrate-binding protein [Pseudomonadota bacterium]
MTEQRRPNNFRGPGPGEVIGPHTDLLREMLAMLDWDVEIRLAQWSRSYNLALSRPRTCVFSTLRTEDREILFKWVGPIGSTTLALIAKRDGDVPEIDDLEAARPYVIGVYTADAREIMLRNRGGYRLDVATDDLLNALKLDAGRIDLWFTDLETLAQVEPALRAKLEVALRLTGEALYLACNTRVSDMAIDQMNAALDTLKAAGADRRIWASYAATGDIDGR